MNVAEFIDARDRPHAPGYYAARVLDALDSNRTQPFTPEGAGLLVAARAAIAECETEAAAAAYLYQYCAIVRQRAQERVADEIVTAAMSKEVN